MPCARTPSWPRREFDVSTFADIDAWLDGDGAVQEDHMLLPPGRVSDELAGLLRARELLLSGAEPIETEEGPKGDRALGDKAIGEGYTAARDRIDAQIAEQLEREFPGAPRFRLRGLSDDDYAEIRAEVVEFRKLDPDRPEFDMEAMREMNVRAVARSMVVPEATRDQAVRLRRKLNRGEWARLLDHVTRLANLDASATSLPNS